MNDLTITSSFMEVLKTPGKTMRYVKELDDGRLAIIQIADPGSRSHIAKWIESRARHNRIMRAVHCAEVATRVSRTIVRSIYKKYEREGEQGK